MIKLHRPALMLLIFVFLSGCGSIANKSTDTVRPASAVPPVVESKPALDPPDLNKITPPPTPVKEAPKPAPPPLPATAPIAPTTISSSAKGWGNSPNTTHTAPSIPSSLSNLLAKYHAYYVGDTATKAVFLTFDEGYENGFTPSILDTLKKNSVKASFFVTKPFITEHPALVARMVNEGHLVVNHTVTHRSMDTLSEKDILAELKGVEDAFQAATGTPMLRYVRPPSGGYSEKSLWVIDKLGFKTIFWSIAYVDWDTAKQPSRQQALTVIESNLHNGAIILLHAVSKTNTDNLNDMLKIIKDGGYEFNLISEL